MKNRDCLRSLIFLWRTQNLDRTVILLYGWNVNFSKYSTTQLNYHEFVLSSQITELASCSPYTTGTVGSSISTGTYTSKVEGGLSNLKSTFLKRMRTLRRVRLLGHHLPSSCVWYKARKSVQLLPRARASRTFFFFFFFKASENVKHCHFFMTFRVFFPCPFRKSPRTETAFSTSLWKPPVRFVTHPKLPQPTR